MKLIYVAFLALLGFSGTPTRPQEQLLVRPNILFIFADDLGYRDLAGYGHPFSRTPSLDRLAQEGTRFTQFYVPNSTCSPARAAFITGQFPSRHRIIRPLVNIESNARAGMPNWLDVQAPSLPRALQQAGYRTAMIGKWHLGGGSGSQLSSLVKLDPMEEGPKRPAFPDRSNAPPVTAYGFEVARTVAGNSATWYNADPYPKSHQVHYWNDEGWRTWSSRAIVDAAVDFLEDHTQKYQNRPFFMNVWLTDPHVPMEPTAEMRQPYQSVPEPYQSYHAMITFMDEQIGRLLKRLKELDLEKSTLVIFSSDNGAVEAPGASNGSLRGWKWSLYEGEIRVPFVVRWPGHVPPGKTNSEAVVDLVDLAPTFCRLAGASMPSDYEPDGLDASDALFGRPFQRQQPMTWHLPIRTPETPELGVRQGPWKLLMDRAGNRVELYNLDEDPGEAKNIAGGHPETVTQLRSTLLGWVRSLPYSK